LTLSEVEAVALAILLALAVNAPGAHAVDLDTPVTSIETTIDRYHGVAVADPYRWLEKGEDQRVKDWSIARDKRTRAYLDGLTVRKPIYDRLMNLTSQTSPSYSGLQTVGDKIFATYNQPPKQQPMIAILGRDADPRTARIIVDPNTLDSKGTTAIDWFVPSPDAGKVAVSLSEGGSEDGSSHISMSRPATRSARSSRAFNIQLQAAVLPGRPTARASIIHVIPAPNVPPRSIIFPSAFISTSFSVRQSLRRQGGHAQ
jgi:hypothetical protein